jgi:hypothetical protein
MQNIQVRSNWPIEHDPNEGEILIHAVLHDGEKRTHDYPGSAPHVEMLYIEDKATGAKVDYYANDPKGNPVLAPWLRAELRSMVDEWIKERATA